MPMVTTARSPGHGHADRSVITSTGGTLSLGGPHPAGTTHADRDAGGIHAVWLAGRTGETRSREQTLLQVHDSCTVQVPPRMVHRRIPEAAPSCRRIETPSGGEKMLERGDIVDRIADVQLD